MTSNSTEVTDFNSVRLLLCCIVGELIFEILGQQDKYVDVDEKKNLKRFEKKKKRKINYLNILEIYWKPERTTNDASVLHVHIFIQVVVVERVHLLVSAIWNAPMGIKTLSLRNIARPIIVGAFQCNHIVNWEK